MSQYEREKQGTNQICGVDDSCCVYKDPNQSVEARVKDLLSRMTLREKAAQMLTIEKTCADFSVIKDLSLGGFFVAMPYHYPDIIDSPTDLVNMMESAQNEALASRLGIPIFCCNDAMHGEAMVHGATVFPHNIGLGAARDADLVQRIGAATALEARAVGMNYIFSPNLAVMRDLRWGRCFESFSEDPELVRSMTSFISGLQGVPPEGHPQNYPFVGGRRKVLGCAMHFVGAGGPEFGLMEGDTKCSFSDLETIHMTPYLDALARGVSTVMLSYTAWNGIRLHEQHFLITNILKEKHGFKGFVISDWEGIDTISDPYRADYRYCVAASFNAGVDMVFEPYRHEEFMDTLTSLVESGDISMARIDDAVERILGIKFIAGLFEHPLADRELLDTVGCKAHRDLAREAVRKSLVLLKNGKDKNKPLLPLDKKAKRILVAGRHADDLGYQCGGWTMTKYGTSGRITIGTTILEAIKEAVADRTEVIYEPDPSPATFDGKEFSYAIAVVGEPAYAESKGYNTELTIPFNGIDIINLVCDNVPTLVVLISGRPLVLETNLLEKMDALVAAWLPGSEGRGITDVVFGDYEFQGLLPVTWLKKAEQLPMNYGHQSYDPLFPLGYGLRMGPNKCNE
ncbi:periplasmic beta-glucosidase-like [Tripterygium wilfordii]|uniref:periplasmic beta-glucosidase-like n=1 Tax=Tripterygium wilfordii TaxID=458696 RepID=UPI0018F850BB|nr:periplasmic beta-glucosidase-like [Tripterygium wilfordii]